MYLKYRVYHEEDVTPRWEICKFIGICFHEEHHFALIALEDGFENLLIYVNEIEYQDLLERIYNNIPNGYLSIDDLVFLGEKDYNLYDKEDINKLKNVLKKMKNKFW